MDSLFAAGRMIGRRSGIRIFPDLEALSHAAAAEFASIAGEAVERRGRFSVALAGGSTPRMLYTRLASEPLKRDIPWTSVHVFWGDERCVPPELETSNYRMAYDALLQGVPVPSGNIHRIRGELEPEKGASLYEAELRDFFAGVALPGFDLVLLGLGRDGHTASLFPADPVLEVQDRLVTPSYPAEIKTRRVTLTLPVINSAETVLFLVSGKEKADIVAKVLSEPFLPRGLPAQRVRPNGSLQWFVDEAAAGKLEHR